jgi:hypothetical protein
VRKFLAEYNGNLLHDFVFLSLFARHLCRLCTAQILIRLHAIEGGEGSGRGRSGGRQTARHDDQ